jgi:magnesium transporter
MLAIYRVEGNRIVRAELGPDMPVPDGALWFDLKEPTLEEVAAVENALDLDVPTADEMKEIEASSRLRIEDGAMIMTAMVLAQSETERPICSAVTFILSRNRLVTLRYADPLPFRVFSARVPQKPGTFTKGEQVLLDLLDAIIDRTADILERIGDEMNVISSVVFGHGTDEQPNGSRDLNALLRRVGHQGDLVSKGRESLVSIGRMLSFLSQRMGAALPKDLRGHVETLTHDAASLSDHASFLSNKVNFLLEATLALINVEQNNIIKIFSVAAVGLMPPTLIASIYGMNFHDMPELDTPYAYPIALIVMVLSAIAPYFYFKKRGWL